MDVEEVTVSRVGLESVEFSDGTSVVRNRPELNKQFADLGHIIRKLHQEYFRNIFEKGSGVSEIRARLTDPDLIYSDEGSPKTAVAAPSVDMFEQMSSARKRQKHG